MIKEINKNIQNSKGLNKSPLTLKQKMAIDLLIQGLRDKEIAEKIKIRRETISYWRNHHPDFIAELERKREEAWGLPKKKEIKTEEEEEALIKEVMSTDLLSLEGIRKRLILKDQLIHQDLVSYNERRTRLIQRLETNIEQAKEYLTSITPEEKAQWSITQQIEDFKITLLTALSSILTKAVSAKTKDEILSQLGSKIDEMGKVNYFWNLWTPKHLSLTSE